MVILKSKREIEMMHEAGKILAACHREIAGMIKPGMSTLEIDEFVERYLAKYKATPEQKGYQGYQYATCASVNDEICHAFPTAKPLKDGDIVTIDFVVNLNGYLADSAWTHPVGSISSGAKRLLTVTKEAMLKGIEKAVPGNRLGDIGHTIQTYVEGEGFSVVRDFSGHGIGRKMHEDPAVLHYGEPGRGLKLREGMVITVEPMVNAGSYRCTIDQNGWTARTVDGRLSAHYEHTVAITPNGPLILT